MKEENKKKLIEGFKHFCKCIDFNKSFLDADAIKFMNEFGTYLEPEIENGLICCGENLKSKKGINGSIYFECNKCKLAYNLLISELIESEIKPNLTAKQEDDMLEAGREALKE